MNTTININLLGKDSVRGAVGSATNAIHRFTSEATKGNKQVSSSSDHASHSLTKIGTSARSSEAPLSNLGKIGSRVGSSIGSGAGRASSMLGRMGQAGAHASSTIHHGTTHASHGLNAMGMEGARAGEEIGKGGQTATHQLGKMGDTGRKAGSSVSQGATVASKSIDGISRSSENASRGLGEMGDLLGMLMGGYGAMQFGEMLWTGATQRQFNQAYLQMKLGNAEAKKMSKNIEDIVAAVPGDDTFMNTLLGSAAARKASIKDLEKLGWVAADYMLAAQKTGQTSIEAQQDLNSYIMTGTTGELQRSRVLAGQVDKLENKKTIHERILALDEALKANGYKGLSQMDIMLIKWETFKGKIQVAATEFGMRILPYLEKGVDFLLDLDEKTHGWTTQIGLAAAGIGTLALALGPVLWSFKEVLGSVGGIGDKLKGIVGKKHKVSFDCGTPCPPVQGGGTGGKGGKTGGKSGGKSALSYLPLIGETIIGAVGGAVTGDFLSNYVIGPSFEGIGSLLGNKDKPFKAYHGPLDILGLGNQDYQVLNYNQQMTKHAKKYSTTGTQGKGGKPIGEVDWGLIDMVKDRFKYSGDVFTKDAKGGSDWFKKNISNKLSVKGGIEGLSKQFSKSGDIFTKDAQSSSKSLKKAAGDAGKWIKDGIMRSFKNQINFGKWASQGLSWIRQKLGKITGGVNLGKWASQGLSWISSRLKISGSLGLSGLASRAAGWIYNRITGHLNMTDVGNYIKNAGAAMVRRKGPAGPALPAGPSLSYINQASGGFRYKGYAGIGQTLSHTLNFNEGNCVDGSLAQMAIAESWGIPTEMIYTTWNGNPHVYSKIGGKTRDIANHALTGSWNAPPRGPGGFVDKPGFVDSSVNINIYGDLYGYSDFEAKVAQVFNGKAKIKRIRRGS